jgi:hypothetical protein
MDTEDKPLWTVEFSRQAEKQKARLPQKVQTALALLARSIGQNGPLQTSWHHYGKLQGRKIETHHCHLNKGKPRYVAVWTVEDLTIKLVEINYVGTHENAPY